MASLNFQFDSKDFFSKLGEFDSSIKKSAQKALASIAREVLRLSQFEVPHGLGVSEGGTDPHPGQLQNSGNVDDSNSDDVLVGYNTAYAARLHEHPEYHFNRGRKGKYLEDPIKNNEGVLLDYLGEQIKGGIGG